jgi:hypothetical protein
MSTDDPYLKQIAGTHYMKMKIQPAEFINKNNLPFAEGNAIKYICRHSAKGGLEDIKKAIHYLEMIKEREYKPEETIEMEIK